MTLSKHEFLERFEKCHESYHSLTALRKDAITTENLYRELFARHRESWAIPEIEDPFLFLIDVYSHGSLFTKVPDFEEDVTPRCYPLDDAKRLAPKSRAVVESLQDFTVSWECFTEGLLRFVDWKNVFAAGGSVAGCLAPLPKEIANASNATSRVFRRKYFHDEFLPGSDIDLFLYGLTEEEAEAKLLEIFDAVQAASPYEIRAFRSAHAISLVSRYPFRHVQIVLRLYNSPSEVLMGFDVDACAAGFDGTNVYVCPRTALAIVTQTNTVDMTRRSPSYEMRLSKYAQRGYEVVVPNLDRDRVDPFLYEKRFDQVKGLSRLLMLERLKTPEERLRYRLQGQMKNANEWVIEHKMRKTAGDVRNIVRLEGGEGIIPDVTGPEVSDYSTVFLPWGPNWPVEKIERLAKKKDRMLNKIEFLPNGQVIECRRTYKLHVCAIGTMAEVIVDPFPNDKIPDNVPPQALETTVHGKVSWLVDNPGRQRIGSFHPITEDDWTEGAYMSLATEALVLAANANDCARLTELLDNGATLAARDFLGRTALHVAVLSGSREACRALLKRPDANMDFLRARLADGRNVLHLAAMRGDAAFLEMILEKRKALHDAMDSAGDTEPAPSDILDIDGSDWDVKLNPLHYSILLGHVEAMIMLLKHGADARKQAVHKDHNLSISTFGFLAIYVAECGRFFDLEKTKTMIETLVKHGASVLQVDMSGASTWHRLASYDQKSSLDAMKVLLKLSSDKDGTVKGLDVVDDCMRTPLCFAAMYGNAEAVALFIEAGATPSFDQISWDALKQRKMESNTTGRNHSGIFGSYQQDSLEMCRSPIFYAARTADHKTLLAFLDRCPNLVNDELTIPKLTLKRSLMNCPGIVRQVQDAVSVRLLDFLLEMDYELKNSNITSTKIAHTRLSHQLQTIKEQIEECNGFIADTTLSQYRRNAMSLVLYQLQGRLKVMRANMRPPEKSVEELEREKSYAADVQECITILSNRGGQNLLWLETNEEKSCDGPTQNDMPRKTPQEPSDVLKYFFPSQRGEDGNHFPHYRCQPVFDSQKDTYRELFNSVVQNQAVEKIQALSRKVKIAVFDGNGSTVLSISLQAGNMDLYYYFCNLAMKQYISHLSRLCGVRQSEDIMRKGDLAEEDNPLRDQLRRLNNLDIVAGDQLSNGPQTTPDLMRLSLEAAEAAATAQSDATAIVEAESNIPLDRMVVHRTIILPEQFPAILEIKEILRGAYPGLFSLESLALPVRLNPLEFAVLSRNVAMVNLVQKTAFQYANFGDQKDPEDVNETDDDDNDSHDWSLEEHAPDVGEVGLDIRYSVCELRSQLYNSKNPDLGGMTIMQIAIAMDDPDVVRALSPYAREYLIPQAAVIAWKAEVDSEASEIATRIHDSFHRHRDTQPTLLQFALALNSKSVANGLISGELGAEIYSWILDRDGVSGDIRKRPAEIISAVTALQWIQSCVGILNIDERELLKRLCSASSPDYVGRTALFYCRSEMIRPLIDATETLQYSFVDMTTTNGSASALVAAACAGRLDLVRELVDCGASVTLPCANQWNVIHHIIQSKPQLYRSEQEETSADEKSEDESWDLSRTLIDAVLSKASEATLSECLLCPNAEHTPLMIAVKKRASKTMLLYLLGKYGELVSSAMEKRDSDLNTVLHHAVSVSVANEVDSGLSLLLQQDPKPAVARAGVENSKGVTPFELALEAVCSAWVRSNLQSIAQQRSFLLSGRGRNQSPRLRHPRKIIDNDTLASRSFLVTLVDTVEPRMAVGFDDVKVAKEKAGKKARETERLARQQMHGYRHRSTADSEQVPAFPAVVSGETSIRTSINRDCVEWTGWYHNQPL